MTPIHDLLNRIRWDKAFGQARFEIGYLDRREGTVHRVALHEISYPADGRHVFELVDAAGAPQRIPFHRIREVLKDGQVIWRRSV